MRWSWRADSGAGTLEYGALVALAAALVAALIGSGVPSQVTPAVTAAVCDLYDAGHCADRDGGSGEPGGEPGGEPSGAPGDGPGEGGPGDSDGSGDPQDGVQEAGTGPGSDPELEQQIKDAQEKYDDLLKEHDEKKGEAGDIDEELMDLLKELIGWNDAKKCFTEGDILACLETAITALPWGKALKFVSKIPKAYKLFDKWRKGTKAYDKIKGQLDRQKKKLDDLKKKRDQQKKDPDKNGDKDRPKSCPTRAPAPNSFAPGTPVLLADGSTAPIEDIRVGDEVHAFDPSTGEEGPRPVTDLIRGSGEKTLVDITVIGGGSTGTITATGGHPFWDPESAEWAAAEELATGTVLRTDTGDWARVTGAEVRSAPQRVYNLTVADLHTYYVRAGAVEPVLVHNSNADPCGPPLKSLHPDSSLDKSSLDFWKKKDTDEIVASLRPGAEESLKVKPDGTIMNGNTRIAVLRERGYDIDSLPREPYGGKKPMTDEDFWDMDQ
ncbi:intein/intein [Murinocardiopsis flavida]|uniref:Intein/intein n=1 Tax=Murinocardiopsis flavida TaxID=645275 RepID=A0A2P8CSW7_9ACTN|nr:Hint domain-containing protein [Murinocardiopsis flavida]PSK88042.1 intein/intein [Murinocardiopsis flavida]